MPHEQDRECKKRRGERKKLREESEEVSEMERLKVETRIRFVILRMVSSLGLSSMQREEKWQGTPERILVLLSGSGTRQISSVALLSVLFSYLK